MFPAAEAHDEVARGRRIARIIDRRNVWGGRGARSVFASPGAAVVGRASDDFDEGSERFKKGDGDGGGSGGVLCESRAVVARSNCR